jgi:hypothetical protein
MKLTSKHLYLWLSITLLFSVCVWLIFIRHPAIAYSTEWEHFPEYSAQTINSLPDDKTADEFPLKVDSPYDIQLFIEMHPKARLKQFWQQLGIANQATDGRYWDTCNDCKAETYDFDLDDEPGREVLLRISDANVAVCHYLIFKRDDAHFFKYKWKLLGNIDQNFGRFVLPQHTIVISGGKTWLLIEALTGTGSGYSHSDTRLFKISRDGVKEWLTYPSKGIQAWRSPIPTQVFDSRLIDCQSKDGITTAEIELSVSYYHGLDDTSLLWEKTQKAVYRTDISTGRLALDRVNSDISETEIEKFYMNDVYKANDILKYNFSHLEALATGWDRKKKEWLQEYLNHCGDSSEKQSLQQILNR